MTTPEAAPDPAATPPASEYTSNLPGLFRQLGITLLVTTYQAGKLIIVRPDGDGLNTHFRGFDTPMGLAATPQRLVLGTRGQIVDFRNMPAVARSLAPAGKHDACFLPRFAQHTGQIDIHEIAFGGQGELWFVNTMFSCLCTLDGISSFVPRWRPAFVSALSPEDRCHLNGLGMRDGQPRYVTALGESDGPAGWRANKAGGGVLIDAGSGTALCRGLSMPHSPRWHADRLWVLESGRGTIAHVDGGRAHAIAELPGFTRGLDFAGPLAFIGLSQIRESNVFGGLPITERLTERTCGVWIVDLRNGQTVGFLRFTAGVQEIFAVSVLPARFPDVLEPSDPMVATSYSIPDEYLSQVAPPRDAPVRQ